MGVQLERSLLVGPRPVEAMLTPILIPRVRFEGLFKLKVQYGSHNEESFT